MSTVNENTPMTARQAEVLDVIRRFVAKQGFPPTVRELVKLCNVRSMNTICGHLEALTRRKRIETVPLIARGLRVLDPK